jgi:hypothetical protein
MIEFLQNNDFIVAQIIIWALTLLVYALISYSRQWPASRIEQTIRDLTPDEYEAVVLRYVIAVQKAFVKAGQDLDDPKIRQAAAKVAEAMIQMMLYGKPATAYLDELLGLLGMGVDLTYVATTPHVDGGTPRLGTYYPDTAVVAKETVL